MDEAGNLLIHTAVGIVSQHAPRIYQDDRGARREVPGEYVLRQDGLLAFDLVSYDRGKPLVIDPEGVYSTYFGGTASTEIGGITVDANGSVYVVGDTYAHDFPTQDPIQGTNNHSENFSAIISKFSPDGQSLVYSTYLGGSGSGSDFGNAIVLDSTGAAYITGMTDSMDFPTVNPLQPSFGGAGGFGYNVFISKISPDGSGLVYSTYLGGSGIDVPYGIQLDSSNNGFVYGSTSSTNFPTVNPTQAAYGGGSSDGFWSVISPDGSRSLFSTYVGGNGMDYVLSLTVNDQEDVYISGPTTSSNFAGNTGAPNTYVAGFFPSSSTSQLTPQGALRVLPGSPLIIAGAISAKQSDPTLFGLLFPPISHGFGSSLGESVSVDAQQVEEIEMLVVGY